MARKAVDAKVVCPFYINEQKTHILCEGIIKDTSCVNKFHNTCSKLSHQIDFCCKDGGRNCLHHRAVMLRYCNEKEY